MIMILLLDFDPATFDLPKVVQPPFTSNDLRLSINRHTQITRTQPRGGEYG